MANAHSPAAVPDADPALEPLEPFSTFHGERHVPPNQMSPYASAPTAVFATSTAPASRSRLTIHASRSGTRSRHGSAPQVVRIPFVSNRSFSPYGRPCSGPRQRPAASSRSAARASAIADSSHAVITHFNFGSSRRMRASDSRTIRSLVISPRRIQAAS
jgi:hypothetical protein